MRGFRILLVAVLVAIGIGVGIEIGSIVTGPKATFKNALESLEASPYLETTTTALIPSATTGVGTEIAKGSLALDIVTDDGAEIADVSGDAHIDEQLSVYEGTADLLDVRLVGGSSAYVRVYPSAIAQLPSISPSDAAALNKYGVLFGGTWFSVPGSDLGVTGGASSGAANAGAVGASVKRLENDVLAMAKFSAAGTPGGTATTAKVSIRPLLAAVERDLGPTFQGAGVLLPSLVPERQYIDSVSGTAAFTVVTGSGSDGLESASISAVTNGSDGALETTVLHDKIALGAPAGARRLSSSILGSLAGLLGGGAAL